jgi:Cysteine-rich secretory protein family
MISNIRITGTARFVMYVSALAIGMCLGPSLSAAAASDDLQLCVDLINTKRATLKLAPLSRWRAGESEVAAELAEDAKTSIPHGAIREAYKHNFDAAQNECQDSRQVVETMIHTCIDDMWAEGPENHDGKPHGHYVNMVSPDYSAVACAFTIAPDGELWSAQDFVPASVAANPFVGSTVKPSAAGAPSLGSQPGKSPSPESPAAPLLSPAPSVAEFDAACRAKINVYRKTLHLPAYLPWDGGAACATNLATVAARGGSDESVAKACLNNLTWASSGCREGSPDAKWSLQSCLERVIKAGVGSTSDSLHRAYGSMTSTEYTAVACGYATRQDGEITIERIYRQ